MASVAPSAGGASSSSSSTTGRRRPQNPPPRPESAMSSSSSGTSAAPASRPRAVSSYSGNTGIDTGVTRLLVSTKTLLHGITEWGQGRTSDDEISNMYVKLGNDLNAVCAAFARERMSMNDLLSVPDELRDCLEACLSEDEASPATLERHLPGIKSIIIRVLQGVKARQAQYKARVAEERAASPPPVPSASAPSDRSSARVASPPPRPTSAAALAQEQRPASASTSSSSATASAGPGHKRNPSAATSVSSNESSRPAQPPPSSSSVSFQEPQRPPSRTSSIPKGPDKPVQIQPRSATSQSLSESAPASSAPSNVLPRSKSAGHVPTARSSAQLSASSPLSQAPALPSFNFESAAGGQSSSDPDLRSKKNTKTDAADQTFQTLKNSDNLSRRASKRFSRYTLDKMTGSPSSSSKDSELSSSAGPGGNIGGAGASASPTSHFRRSFRPQNAPPMPTAPRAAAPEPNGNGSLRPRQSLSRRASGKPGGPRAPPLEPTELSDPGAVDSGQQSGTPPPPPPPSKAHLSPLAEQSESPGASSSSLGQGDDVSGPGSPTNERKAALAALAPSAEAQDEEEQDGGSEEDEPGPIQIYVQCGRETKKATLDADQLPPTIAALRIIFMDRFGYNPGQEDFPQIYIREPKLGIEYELEDMYEVKEGVLLSLNVEPLDQVKQHIDLALSGITVELKDLKSAMSAASRRSLVATTNQAANSWSAGQSPPAPAVSATAAGTSTPAPVVSPTRQTTPARASTSTPEPPRTPVSPAVSTEVSSTLRKYQDEVQHVRRDLAVLRQIYGEYSQEHRGVISRLRSQVDHVKTLAVSKVSSSRAFIDAGKTKLDGRSQDLLTKIEGLMDSVESIRDDVTVRRMRPHHSKMDSLRKQIEGSRGELDDVLGYMSSVKPAWKKTWSEELQNVVEEQRFLKHQEELLEEMAEDHKEMASMFENIDELMKKMGPSASSSGSGSSKNSGRMGLRGYVPPEPDKDHQGLETVINEVRSLAVDPEKRLRAIQQAEQARQESAEKARQEAVAELTGGENKHQEFVNELGNFASSKQLRKTGGAEETERVRQIKDQEALKNMFASQVALPESPGSTESRPLSAAS